MYAPHMQQQGSPYPGSFYEAREQPLPPPPPQQQQLYLQHNQHAYVTNAPPVYHQQQQQHHHQQPHQFNNGYMSYHQQNMDFPAYHDHFGAHPTLQRTAVGARGASSSDHADLIKSSSNQAELSTVSFLNKAIFLTF